MGVDMSIKSQGIICLFHYQHQISGYQRYY